MEVKRESFEDLKPFYRAQDARLSEGVTYLRETDTLVWVDIYKGLIHKIEQVSSKGSSGRYDSIEICPGTYNEGAAIQHPDINRKESVGVVFPIVQEGDKEVKEVIFGSKFGIGRSDFSRKKWEYLALYTDCAEIGTERAMRLRSNDGNVSPCGKYVFVGLMNDFPYQVKDEGCIVQVSLQESRKVELFWDKIKIPNAIHWNKTGTDMYVTDSLEFVIWKVNTKSGERKKFIDVKKYNSEFESPEPDGSAINHMSNTLFVAIWSASRVQEYSLESGKLVREFLLPKTVPRVSCCATAGDDLYVTTASAKAPNGSETAEDTFGGSLYRLANVVQPAVRESSKRQPVFVD